MIDPLYLIPVAVFFGIVLLGIALAALTRARGERRKIVSKIKTSDSATFYPDSGDSAAALGVGRENTVGGFFSSIFAPLGQKISPKKDREVSELRKTFLRAGYRGEYAIPVFYGAKIVCTVLAVAAYYLANLFFIKKTNLNIVMATTILSALVGYSLPSHWLRFRTMRRKLRIFEGLPDALDMMVVCVEAGMGMDAAIHRVSEEIQLENKVVSDEFKMVGLELRAGKARGDALKSLAMRCDHEDVSSLVALLIQTDRFGTSVAQALRVHSDAMRVKRFQKAEEKAAKLPVKLVFPLILFIFPALFVVIVGPAAIRIYRNLIVQ